MKMKNVLLAFNSILLLVSISQIFSIPPYSSEVFSFYKSGYFSGIDREFKILIDAFTSIKLNGRAEAGWVFFNELDKTHGVKASVFNKKGERVIAPGYYDTGKNQEIINILNSVNPGSENISLNNGIYRSIIAVRAEKKCLICHNSMRENDLIGAFKFERKFDAHIYYTSERIIIFTLISLVLLALLLLTVRWDPESQIKELFDKKK